MRSRHAAAVAGVLAALVATGPGPVGAQAEPEAAGAAPDVAGPHVTGVVADDPAVGIHPAVAELAVDGDELDLVSGDLRASLAQQQDATDTIAAADAHLDELAGDEARLEDEVAEAERVRGRERRRVDDARQSLRAVALDAYVQAGGSSRDGGPLDPEHIDDDMEREALAGSVRQHHADELLDAQGALAEAEEQLASLVAELEGVRDEQAATAAERDAAAERLAAAEARIPGEQEDVDDAWRTAMVRGTDIPLVAADAYYRAALALVVEDPTCGLRWEALAGIGRVEGHHGSFGAAELHPDGTSDPRIIGIPLDGSKGTRAIADTDGGALDGDTTVDRAVGPMQFIPSTWARWATDGDGDGLADPHSMYDAARTAGVYLCQSGPGLDTDEGLVRAFFSYNRSAPYGQRVLALTHEYDAIGL